MSFESYKPTTDAIARCKRISFTEQNHSYTVDGMKDTHTSCTKFLKEYSVPFDADLAIRALKNGKNWNSNNVYFTMTDAQIKKKWIDNGKKTSSEGTKLHSMIQSFYKQQLPQCVHDVGFGQFIEFFNDYKDIYSVCETEMSIFCDYDKERLTGSFDVLFKIKGEGGFALGDWKRVKKIERNSYGHKKMLPPINHLEDCNFNQYSLQLNLYRYILQKYYSYQIDEMFMVVFSTEKDAYEKVDVKTMDKEIEMLLQDRAKRLGVKL